MMRLRRRLVACLMFAALAGFVYPYGELVWKCRVYSAESEACVWARAYFPLPRWIEPVIVAPIVFALTALTVMVAGRRR